MQLPKGPGEAVLDEVVGRYQIVCQRAGKAPQAGNFSFDLAIGGGHSDLLPLAPGGRATDPNGCDFTDGL